MTDKLKDLQSCAKGRRKEMSKDFTSNLPKVNRQDLIDRILVKPHINDPSCPDLSVLTTTNNLSSRVNLPKISNIPHINVKKTLTYQPAQDTTKTFTLPKLKTEQTCSIRTSAKFQKLDDLYGMTDLDEVVRVTRTVPQVDFLYLSPVVKKNSVHYHYYCLKTVAYQDIDNTDYCTMSKRGFMRAKMDEDPEFVHLDRFQQEFTYFQQLVKIRLFRMFRQWKAFSTWKKNVKFERIEQAQSYLQQHLFFSNDILRKSLLKAKGICMGIDSMVMCRLREGKLYTLEDFLSTQRKQVAEVCKRLLEHRESLKKEVMAACKAVFKEANFSTEQKLENTSKFLKVSHMKLFNDMSSEPHEVSYTEQVNRRTLCRRLTCFIRLVDYLVVDTLHMMVLCSIRSLLYQFVKRTFRTPCEESVVEWLTSVQEASNSPLNTDKLHKKLADRHKPKLQSEMVRTIAHVEGEANPIFVIEYTLLEQKLVMKPTENAFNRAVKELLLSFQEAALQVECLVTDPFFDSFTRPVFSSRSVRPLRGDGPDLKAIFTKNKYTRIMFGAFEINMADAFKTARIYISTFTSFVEMYAENRFFDAEDVKTHDDVIFYSEALSKYHRQFRMFDVIQTRKALGLLFIDATSLKNILLPSPINCLDIIHTILPWTARKDADRLTSELQDAEYNLESQCTTTKDYVTQLVFLEQIQERMDDLVKEAQVVRDLYGLIEQYAVPTPPEDFAVYATLTPSINAVYNQIDESLAERDKNIVLFNASIDKDIADFNKELKALKHQVQNPIILDPDIKEEAVFAILSKLNEKLAELKERASIFKEFQTSLNVSITSFEELDDVSQELMLKQLLWDSITNWDKLLQQWMKVNLETLVPEELIITTNNFATIVSQLEKGLPPNGVVPKLKERVDKMKIKLPLVASLRNPALKERHWEIVRQILDYNFTPEDPLTLGRLESLKAFQHVEALQQVAGQASDESSLEYILKKVEDAWKSLEFSVLPYKEQKEVYVLGSIDDIQFIFDDSLNSISAIISSKHVTPIKAKVDAWSKQLNLFGATLEAWMQCQHSWLYFESIFSAPDIQRQLPAEAKMFSTVDKSFREIMRKVCKVPLAIRAATQPGLLESFQNNNLLIDQVQKCMDAYLESKRVLFPRFYFLSNDEMLEILSQGRNPQAVQPHLRKCFDAILRIEFASMTTGTDTVTSTNEILSMISPEGEKVVFGKGLKARGNVEDWLGKVEEVMMITIRKLLSSSITNFLVPSKEVWITSNISQVVLTVVQCMWCKDITELFERKGDKMGAMREMELRSIHELNKLMSLARSNLSYLDWLTTCTLIVIEVHMRDVVMDLVRNRVTKADSFEWRRQMKYFWDKEEEKMVVRMGTVVISYGNEYIGNTSRLVVTPLTDRVFLCLLGATQLNLGACSSGPAGTGKTESTKDLAKAVAIKCMVFNCSPSIDYRLMGRFFAGLAQSGTWSCFDEFNRINIEVLSVVGQQLFAIRNAKIANLSTFLFEGREIKFMKGCNIFVTINPGYLGRTELPDNLKSLLRPISMMLPDYAMISEVIMLSLGFETAKVQSQKVTQMYKLSSEQLTKQDHYDFGMRALKSILVAAGNYKRLWPEKDESLLMIRALRDFNIPRLVSDDVVLFEALIGDMFPGVDRPETIYSELQEDITQVAKESGLQMVPKQVKKVIQLYEILKVRHGIILVGAPGGGKTIVLDILADLCRKKAKEPDPSLWDNFFRPVRKYTLNPKAISLDELYGFFDPLTMEWIDGLVGTVMRQAVNDTSEDHQWVLYDGPLDVKWVENMNTALDDNALLCLSNSERIKLNPNISMFFEVDNVAMASPTTISRCGTVYFSDELGWQPYMRSWMEDYMVSIVDPETYSHIESMFLDHVDNGLKFVENCRQAIPQTSLSRVQTICKLLEALLISSEEVDFSMESQKLLVLIDTTFVWCYLWGLAGNIHEEDWDMFDGFVRLEFQDYTNTKMPTSGTLWAQRIDFSSRRLELWDKSVSFFKYYKNIPFTEMVVPSADTVKFGYLLDKLVMVDRPVLFVGATGVGKTTISRNSLGMLNTTKNVKTCFFTFSAQTSSSRLQELIQDTMDRKRKNILGAPPGCKKVIIMIDDMNMPKLDLYGSQPPIELLRQVIGEKGFYHRGVFYWKHLQNLTICAACGLPGGGRNTVSPRLLRHFSIINLPLPNNHGLRLMFNSILGGHFLDFNPRVRHCIDLVVRAGIEIYGRLRVEFLPTPNKSHYVFNLRDLSKCMQGVTQASQTTTQTPQQLYKLFYHEALRVFHDRLVTTEDKQCFYQILADTSSHYFVEMAMTAQELEVPMIFGDFIRPGLSKEDRLYQEISINDRFYSVLNTYMDSCNQLSGKENKLIFFMDAIEHLARISRILRPERGNALLVGVGGCGKRSLTVLASHMSMCNCFQIQLKRGYNHASFHEDLRSIYHVAGIRNETIVLLLSDSQILVNEFLEDLNNILNSGFVPNLFNDEDYEKNINLCRSDAKEAGVEENSRENIFQFFINRVVRNLHIVLCMSPLGNSFRTWCRMFPALVSCCTIDWYVPWPHEALLSVSEQALMKADLGIGATVMKELSLMCVSVHESVVDMTTKFYNELKRRYYVGPSSYLEFISLYINMHAEKKKQLISSRDRLINGLSKITETNQLVIKMKNDLILLEPEMKEKSERTEKLMEKLAEEQADADEVRRIVMVEEITAEAKAVETQAMAEDAQRDLDEALPALENAVKSLDALDKNDISEIRVYTVPPELVQTVMEAVCMLLGVKTDWQSARILLGDSTFLKRLYDYDKDHIPDALMKKLKKYIDNPKFSPEAVEKVSRASKSLCMWVRAIDMYAHIFRNVEPKRKKLELAQEELDAVDRNLNEKKDKLLEVQAEIKQLQDMYEFSVEEKLSLTRNIVLTQTRLRRAGKLTTALVSEKSRWEDSVENFNDKVLNVVGDVFISAACIVYFGAFSTEYREKMLHLWIQKSLLQKIPVTPSMNLIAVLADPLALRQWSLHGLPNDKVSIENAVLATRCQRWPLMIDPQEQANRWIRNMELPNGIKVIHPHKRNYIRIFQEAISMGVPVLLEDVEESLDAVLDPILFKMTYMNQEGRLMMMFGDEEIEYNRNFKFYMTTKLSNPHYMIETCMKVTIINFTVTKDALEDQLLGDVVRLERMDLEDQFNQLIFEINAYTNQMRAIEDRTLKLLFDLEGNILDNEDLINTLNESKVTAGVVYERLMDAKVTEEKILVSREKYRVVATRGSILYSVVAHLSNIDIMYQFSLKYFKALFCKIVVNCPPSKDLDSRLNIILNHTLRDVYKNVARGLFERDKTVFSFLLCTELMKDRAEISDEEWEFFLRGAPTTTKMNSAAFVMYQQAAVLSKRFSVFKHILKELKAGSLLSINIGSLNVTISNDEFEGADVFEEQGGEEEEEDGSGDDGEYQGTQNDFEFEITEHIEVTTSGMESMQSYTANTQVSSEEAFSQIKCAVKEEGDGAGGDDEISHNEDFGANEDVENSGIAADVNNNAMNLRNVFDKKRSSVVPIGLRSNRRKKSKKSSCFNADSNIIVLALNSNEMVSGRASDASNSAPDKNNFTSFQNVMLIKVFRDNMLSKAVIEFVKDNLGMFFVKSEIISLNSIFEDTNNHTPLLFILSPASDPMDLFIKFVKEKDYLEKYHAISMGQGQGVIAKASLNLATKSGHWVFLQNIHLASSWMSQLEEIVKSILDKPSEVNPSFRLFLSSSPTPSFPVAILQNSLKVTNESPKGLKASVSQALNNMDPTFFEDHPLGQTWKKILFSLCLFHAVIVERKKFGSLGWICDYDFSDHDRECGFSMMKMFFTTANIPWDSIIHSVSEFLYGGRVTDQWDQRCLRTILKRFLHPDILIEGYSYSESGIYFPPNLTSLADYKKYIERLPAHDPPEIFCMHKNSDIIHQRHESRVLLETIVSLQPRQTSANDEETFSRMVQSQATHYLMILPETLSIDNANKDLYNVDDKGHMDSLTTVLLQEYSAFNQLLKRIKLTLHELDNAIMGLVLMDEDLESVYMDILNNKLPRIWSSKAYNCLMPLSSWVADLVLRCNNIQNWINNGEPLSFWISGLYYPQGFLKAVLQRHARKYFLAIDRLSFRYHVLSGLYFNHMTDGYMSRARYQEVIRLALEQVIPSDSKDTRFEENFNQSSKVGFSISRNHFAPNADEPIVELPGVLEDTFGNGVIVHGLFADGFKWDDEECCMGDPTDKQMSSLMPLIIFEPVYDHEPSPFFYPSPLFRTPERRGMLSTTGHSTNFVVTIYLNIKESKDYWVGRGSALVCQLNI